ncbi:MAG: CRISPR-associated protein Cas6 [Desulfobacterales bacterium]|nr:MAG: CRISPR-associated protein Cas6 [Desulfobacterales bacterium]
MAITFLSLHITCRFLTTAILPSFKGSTLRGSFGHALKSVVCTLRNQQCNECLLNSTCAYSLIFATEKIKDDMVSARPHPYILTPPMSEKRLYNKGDTFSFGLTLLGSATTFLPHIIYCLEEMGRQGLGKKTAQQEGRFTIVTVSTGETVIYREDKKELLPARHEQVEVNDHNESVSTLLIQLRTPLRLKDRNTFVRRLTFLHLVRAALRRIRILEISYGDTDIFFDYKRLCSNAEEIALVSDNTHWKDYQRYSNRQKHRMLLGGVMGSLIFKGDMGVYLPFFRYIEKVRLGKQTAFGLGRISFEVIT